MNEKNWEENIILVGTKTDFEVLGPVKDYVTQEDIETDLSIIGSENDIKKFVEKDTSALPTTEDREGYHGNRHYDYWLSGLSDFKKIITAAEACDVPIDHTSRILDFGCATGRVIRHFAAQSEIQPWGCDISENHVLWCNRYLPNEVKVFQNTSIPQLPIEDNFFNIIFAMSVFTHIEAFETTWLCEMARVLKPGGIAYVTIHDETSWDTMPSEWGAGYAVINHPDFNKEWLKTGFPGDKFVSRWHADKSYSSNVFYKLDYIKRVWGKFFEIHDIIPKGSLYQTVLVLQKRKE